MKPLGPFSRESQGAIHRPFTDYQSGEIMEGKRYFKRLGKTILQYLAHPEQKYDGDIGLLERKHIVAVGVFHIGKEANSVDEQAPDVKQSQVFVNERGVQEEILNMSYKEGERREINRGTLWRMKKRISTLLEFKEKISKSIKKSTSLFSLDN